jgi:hypothetical protein
LEAKKLSRMNTRSCCEYLMLRTAGQQRYLCSCLLMNNTHLVAKCFKAIGAFHYGGVPSVLLHSWHYLNSFALWVAL